jgi:hypothetical protein
VRSAKTQKRSRPSAILDISQGAHEIAGKRIRGRSRFHRYRCWAEGAIHVRHKRQLVLSERHQSRGALFSVSQVGSSHLPTYQSSAILALATDSSPARLPIDIETRSTDAKGRISLPKAFANATVSSTSKAIPGCVSARQRSFRKTKHASTKSWRPRCPTATASSRSSTTLLKRIPYCAAPSQRFPVAMTDWRIERLGPHHDRSGFSCGKPPPGDFILKLVIQYEKRNLGRTYVAVKPGELQVRGYYTIGSGAVPFTNLPAPSAHKLPRHPVLVILLARLAVDHSAKGQKLGESLPLDALGRSLTLAEALGIHAVEVNAIDQQARAFIRNLVLAHYIPSPLRKERLEDSSPRVPFSILISEATIMCGHSAKVGRTTGDRIMPSVVRVHGIAQQFKGVLPFLSARPVE